MGGSAGASLAPQRLCSLPLEGFPNAKTSSSPQQRGQVNRKTGQHVPFQLTTALSLFPSGPRFPPPPTPERSWAGGGG